MDNHKKLKSHPWFSREGNSRRISLKKFLNKNQKEFIKIDMDWFLRLFKSQNKRIIKIYDRKKEKWKVNNLTLNID